jgi:hypothetical protein
MKSLQRKLNALDKKGARYQLAFLTLTSGFVYRDAAVLEHDEETILIHQAGHGETYIKMSEIATANVKEC